jgi:hypothetical protein
MAYELTFAGETLRLPDADTIAALESCYPFVTGTEEVWRCDAPGGRLSKLSCPYPDNRKVGLNQLWYPSGATRYSVFRTVAAYADLEEIISAAFTNQSTGATLTIRSDGDSTDTGISTAMYLLPPRPVSDITSTGGIGQSQLYWLTFVDERYWWQKAGPTNFFTGSTSGWTWANLIAYLIESIWPSGITIDQAIESVYGYPEPDSALYTNGENAAVLLDVALANVGRRLVRNLNGNYHAVRCNTAIASSKTDRASYTKRMGGGQILPDTLAGSDPDYLRGPLVPAGFTFFFPYFVAGLGYVEQAPAYRSFVMESYGKTYNYDFATSTLSSPYSGFATGAGSVCIRSTAKALITSPSGSSPTNATQLQNLSKQLATDWIDSQMQYLDETYRGIVTINTSDNYDVLWDYAVPSTRIMREPFGRNYLEFQHGFGPQEPFPGPLVVEDAQDVNFVNSVQVLQFATSNGMNGSGGTVLDAGVNISQNGSNPNVALVDILDANFNCPGLVSLTTGQQMGIGIKNFDGIGFPVVSGYTRSSNNADPTLVAAPYNVSNGTVPAVLVQARASQSSNEVDLEVVNGQMYVANGSVIIALTASGGLSGNCELTLNAPSTGGNASIISSGSNSGAVHLYLFNSTDTNLGSVGNTSDMFCCIPGEFWALTRFSCGATGTSARKQGATGTDAIGNQFQGGIVYNISGSFNYSGLGSALTGLGGTSGTTVEGDTVSDGLITAIGTGGATGTTPEGDTVTKGLVTAIGSGGATGTTAEGDTVTKGLITAIGGGATPQAFSVSQAVLGSETSLSGSIGSWVDSGISISISAGTYLVSADVWCSITIKSITSPQTGLVQARLVNGAGTEITNSRRVIVETSGLNIHIAATGSMTNVPYTASGSDSIHLQCQARPSGAGTLTLFEANIEGQSGSSEGLTVVTVVSLT